MGIECEHDHEWVDESFDHEMGTESCGHWECIHCEHVDEDREAPDASDFDEHN